MAESEDPTIRFLNQHSNFGIESGVVPLGEFIPGKVLNIFAY